MVQREELARVLEVLEPVLDIVDAPVDTPAPPAWCSERGWSEFLLRLDDEALFMSERGGFAARLANGVDAPPDLRELAAGVSRCTRLPSLGTNALAVPELALRGVAARKRGQLAVLLGALPTLAAHAERIVDVGGGRGHFACLAAELFQRRVLILDRNAPLLMKGVERSATLTHETKALGVEFVEIDIGQQPLVLQMHDLAVGLHACGELGDRLIAAAGVAGCDVALVSCCFQKTSSSTRPALSRAARGLEIRRGALGLANLAPRDDGVEASLADNLRAREARLALRYLLSDRGLEIGAGEEMRGVNRRRAQSGFGDLATHVCALRRLPSPTPAELRAFADAAQRASAVMRRLTLPRHLLSRLVEIAIVRDRAAALEERGLAVAVAQLFEDQLTPRNTVLFASEDPARLPPLCGE
jgi:hypothetical protein